MYSPNKQVGTVDPALATQQQPAQQIPQAVQQPVQQITNVPPAPSNTLGQAQPVFNPANAQQNAQECFGSVADNDKTLLTLPLCLKKNAIKNTNMKKDIKTLANQKLQGQVGENAVWDGPLSKAGFSNGCRIKFRNYRYASI